ncbi:MAG TPA: AAA family ATPase [Candidatus Baltobacteraceae bacterium]|nr:AAA family ATPase [Candidatus Baltobacteraceae bacterium]
MARTAILCCLPIDECTPVGAALTEAGFSVLHAATAAAAAPTLAKRRDIGVAIIDGETDFDDSLELYSLLHGNGQDVPTLMVVSPKAFERLTTNTMDADSTEYFTRPYSAESLRWRVEAMLIRSQTFDDGSGPILAHELPGDGLATRALVVGIFNPKGGVGKTSVATNLASALQTQRGQNVLLIDADTTSGHIATSLGLEHLKSVADALDDDEGVPRNFGGIAAAHANGLRVAALVSNPLQVEQIDPAVMGEALGRSRFGFDVVIIDMHPDYGALNRAIFERCDRILVPVTPDVPALRAAMQFMEIADQAGLRDRLTMVVNRANSGVSIADMEKTTGLRAFAEIRSAGPFFVKAANEGTTVVERFPREKVTEDFLVLADRLLDRAPQPQVERGFLGNLLSRPQPARV